MNLDALKATAMKMVGDGKGILAADESTPTIGKRLKQSTQSQPRNPEEDIVRCFSLQRAPINI